jgi:hypothetical protein
MYVLTKFLQLDNISIKSIDKAIFKQILNL